MVLEGSLVKAESEREGSSNLWAIYVCFPINSDAKIWNNTTSKNRSRAVENGIFKGVKTDCKENWLRIKMVGRKFRG